MTHRRPADAERVVREIEARVALQAAAPLGAPLSLMHREHATLAELVGSLFATYPKRTVLCLTLMATQAFCYNAIFFTYALVLTTFFHVPGGEVGWFILPFAAGNFLGPLLLGPLFDTLGRRTMISTTYGLSGVLLAASGYAFQQGWFGAVEQTIAWSTIFFFASAGASAAYLTVGELFPLELRARTIAIFYAFGTALGGIAGPAVFGALIQSGSREQILIGYLFGGGLMVLAALVEMALGVSAERKALEEVAPPLSHAQGPSTS
jgi:MFS family permease